MHALRCTCTISALCMMANASCAGSEKSIAVSLVREDQKENNFDHFLEDSTEGEPFSLFCWFPSVIVSYEGH